MSGMAKLGGSIERAQSPVGAAEETLERMIMRQTEQINRALPKAANMTPEKLARVALTVIKADSKLSSCSSRSMLAALMVTAQLGLEPGPLGHVYFSPRWNGKLNQNEVQFTLGYKGIIELARRAGVKIEARDVREGDTFDVELGLEPKLRHVPNFNYDADAPTPRVIAYYMVARFPDGSTFFHVMTKHEIERHRMRSDSGKKNEGPWKSDYDAMARKTVVRAAHPYLPLAPDTAEALARAFNADETVRTSYELEELDVPRPIDVPSIEEGATDGNAEGDEPGGARDVEPREEVGDREEDGGAESDRGDDRDPRATPIEAAGVESPGPAAEQPPQADGGDRGAHRVEDPSDQAWLDTIDSLPDTSEAVGEFIAAHNLGQLRQLARVLSCTAPRKVEPKAMEPIIKAIARRKGMTA